MAELRQRLWGPAMGAVGSGDEDRVSVAPPGLNPTPNPTPNNETGEDR